MKSYLRVTSVFLAIMTLHLSDKITAVQSLWTPMETKFDIYKDDNNEVSIETDFNLGY